MKGETKLIYIYPNNFVLDNSFNVILSIYGHCQILH